VGMDSTGYGWTFSQNKYQISQADLEDRKNMVRTNAFVRIHLFNICLDNHKIGEYRSKACNNLVSTPVHRTQEHVSLLVTFAIAPSLMLHSEIRFERNGQWPRSDHYNKWPQMRSTPQDFHERIEHRRSLLGPVALDPRRSGIRVSLVLSEPYSLRQELFAAVVFILPVGLGCCDCLEAYGF
jgi:hypothetical protein